MKMMWIVDIKGIYLRSQFSHNVSHNVRRIPLTLWLKISDDIRILLTIYLHFVKYFLRKKEFFRKEIVPWKKHRKIVNFGPIWKKNYIFEMKIKKWIEWTIKMSKIW